MRTKRRILVTTETTSTEMLQGVQQYLLTHSELRPSLCLINADNVHDVRRLKRVMSHVRFDGILAPVSDETRDLLENAPQPVVNISDVTETSLPTVRFDQQRIGRLAAEHLLQQGLRTFAYASSKSGLYSQLRWQGFRARIRQAGFDCLLLDKFMRYLSGGPVVDAAFRQWLARAPKPLGMHLNYTALAIQVIWACQELNLRVPEDVAVLSGMDRPVMTTIWQPTLSAFELQRWRLGYEAVKLLHALMRGCKPPSGPVLIPPGEIIQRHSTDVLATRDAQVAQAIAFIRDNAHRPITVKELVGAVSLSRRAMERRFEKVMHCSLHDEIVRVHMERAKTLLRQTTTPVGQVALQAGFASYVAFAAAFRKHARTTPRAYRSGCAVNPGFPG